MAEKCKRERSANFAILKYLKTNPKLFQNLTKALASCVGIRIMEDRKRNLADGFIRIVTR